MSDLQSQKYRIDQMRQELNQFSRAANDALSRQYLNAATLQKLGIVVPPNKPLFPASLPAFMLYSNLSGNCQNKKKLLPIIFLDFS